MHYGFDEDEEAFRSEMRRWAEKVLAPHYQSDDKAAKFRRQQALDMAQMGLTSLRIPEEYGGQDATAVIAGIAAEEVGREDFNAGYLIINTALISDIIVRNATDEQKAAWLPGIASGETIPSICITEPGHGTDAASLELRATPTADGDGWTLHGEKTSITLGMASDRAVVGLPEVNMGTLAGAGGTQRVTRLARTGVALRMLLLGDLLPAGEALEHGLVDRVVADAELETATTELARRLAAGDPRTTALILDAVRLVTEGSNHVGLAGEAALFGMTTSYDTFRERISAFRSKNGSHGEQEE